MGYRVIPADPIESRTDVLGLWRRNLPEASEDRFAWLYQSGRSRAWLLHGDDGSPVGAAGLMDRSLHTPDGLVPAGQAIDLNVDQTHRSVGPALSLARAVVEEAGRQGGRLIYAFPNEYSAPVLRRVGYRDLGSFQRWVKPLRANAVADRLHRPLARLAVSAASPVINTALAAGSREAYTRRPADVQVTVADRFDASFDAFWEKASSRFAFLGERTSAYLTWRFSQCPEARHEVLSLRDGQQNLLAYLVYCNREGTVYVNDFLFADVRNLHLLWAEFLRLMRRRKAAAVITMYLGDPAVSQALRKFGFWQRPAKWATMVHAKALPSVLEEQRWHLTRADVDTNF